MISHPLIETLSRLSQDEITLLDKFIHSELNHHSDNASGVIELFDLLKQYAPDFKDKKAIDRDQIALVLGLNGIERLASNLHNVVEKYIKWIYLEESSDEFFHQLGLLNFYLKKYPSKFEAQFNAMEAYLLSNFKKKDNDTYFKLFLIHYRKTEWMQAHQPGEDNNLLNSLRCFNTFALIQKAQIIFNLKLRSENAIFEFSGYDVFLEEMQAFKNSGFEVPDILPLYELALQILHDQGDVQPHVFQDLLLANKKALPRIDYKNLASLERNLYLKEILQGKIHFTHKIFEIYKRHLGEGVLEIEELTQIHFANIVRYACRCGELTWVEDFLNKSKNRFIKGDGPNLYKLYLGYYQLHNGDFSNALSNLSFKFKDAIRKVDARCIELMVLFKIQFQDFYKRIDSFEKLVKNSKQLNNARKEGYLNFIDGLRKLTKLDPNHNQDPNLKKNLEGYHAKIDKVIAGIKIKTSEAIWLVNQLQQLKKPKASPSQ